MLCEYQSNVAVGIIKIEIATSIAITKTLTIEQTANSEKESKLEDMASL